MHFTHLPPLLLPPLLNPTPEEDGGETDSEEMLSIDSMGLMERLDPLPLPCPLRPILSLCVAASMFFLSVVAARIRE